MAQGISPKESANKLYPPLKQDSGGGDVAKKTPVTSALTIGWRINPRKAWMDRWPEFVSACWMCIIIFVIGFLVFLTSTALSATSFRRKPAVYTHCNVSRPGSEVFYHELIQRDRRIQFSQYSDYLTMMANYLPHLRFNLIFLTDDYRTFNMYRSARHPRYLNTFLRSLNPVDEVTKKEMTDFQQKHPNVNICIMSLASFMEMTPLRYRWTTIPTSHLIFYARVFAVWQSGGIAMELNGEANFRHLDIINKIFKQHNDGVSSGGYEDVISRASIEPIGSDMVPNIYELFSQLWNETTSLFKHFESNSISQIQDANKPLVRTHRSKRDVDGIVKSVNDEVLIRNDSIVNITAQEKPENDSLNTNPIKQGNIPKEQETTGNINDSTPAMTESNQHFSRVYTDPNAVVMFYDFSIFTDDMFPPPLPFSELFASPFAKKLGIQNQPVSRRTRAPIPLSLVIEADGKFIAAPTKLHPFLGQVMSLGCSRKRPRSAIQSALMAQCPGVFKEDSYCRSVHIVY